MTLCIPILDPITPEWLTEVLRVSGILACGEVVTVTSTPTDVFNSATSRLQVRYSVDAAPDLPAQLILKQNLPEPWAIEAAMEEVKFYRSAVHLDPSPPALVPCYAAAFDPASGNSYLLLQDLSQTHAPPVTRKQQVSIIHSVPERHNVERVVDTLAQHHAYWWNHPDLADGTFTVGYWSRTSERFAAYLQRRQAAWDDLCSNEALWFPDELRELYEKVLGHLPQHWERYLEPRFRSHSHLTLVHGDAYFANFLCPQQSNGSTTYLLDWQSPTVDINGYDLANLFTTFWTSEQRQEKKREWKLLKHYHSIVQTYGVVGYTLENLITDYKTGLIFWLLMPVQDRYGGSPRSYWWPKMQCLVAAFHEWHCVELLGIAD